MLQEINVNELNNALQKAFKVKRIFIDRIIAGSLHKRPEVMEIGIGGQLTLQFSTSRKIKGLPVITKFKPCNT